MYSAVTCTCTQARQIAEIINSGIQPVQNLSVLKRVNELVGNTQKQEWALHFIQEGFKGIVLNKRQI